MIRLELQVDNYTVVIQREDAEGVDDCVSILNEIFDCHPNIEGEIELIEEEDDNIYIEPNQPKDHIEHEGM